MKKLRGRNGEVQRVAQAAAGGQTYGTEVFVGGFRELVEELRCLTDENKLLKQENNKLEFELQKSREECLRLKKTKEQWQDKADE
jgi:hypothetical protein